VRLVTSGIVLRGPRRFLGIRKRARLFWKARIVTMPRRMPILIDLLKVCDPPYAGWQALPLRLGK
jgi:hypothetical protein